MKPNKETYRILVIDDHPIVAEGIIALASQLEGVTCKGATCAKDVEQLTLKERFDLCIIDLELPDMNGFQLISHLHSQIPECGILIYTMHEEPWIIAKLSTLNINGAVSKNASTSELRDAISTLKNGTRCGSSDSLHFSMGCHIIQCFCQVMGTGYDPFFADNHCPYRDFAPLCSLAGFYQCLFHEVSIVQRHHQRLMSCSPKRVG